MSFPHQEQTIFMVQLCFLLFWRNEFIRAEKELAENNTQKTGGDTEEKAAEKHFAFLGG